MGMSGITNIAPEEHKESELLNADHTQASAAAELPIDELGKPGSPENIRDRMERIREVGRENAYKRGVNEVSDDPVIFVDPDKLDGKTPAELGQQLSEILDDFHPDAKASLLETMNSDPSSPRTYTIDDIAENLSTLGPSALPEVITIDGETHGLAIVPNNDLDTKEELVHAFLDDRFFNEDQVKAIVDNMPGSDREWMRIVGNHEGEHMNTGRLYRDTIETLQNEAVADEVAIETANARNDGDVADAFEDLRALSADQLDVEHSTGALLHSGDQASIVHAEVAESYLDIMMDIVDNDPSVLISSDYAQDVLENDPEQFFAIINNHIETETAKTLAAYQADPTSNEAIGNAVVLQTFTNYANDFEGAYRRRALGQEDFPKSEPTQLVPQDVETAYHEFANKEARIEQELTEIEFEANQEFKTGEHFNSFDWESYEGDATVSYQLYMKDPEAYYAHVENVLDDIQEDLVKAYNEDPSYENAENLIKLEAIYQQQFSNRDYKLGPTLDGEVRSEAPDLISDEATRAHIEERIAREDYVPDPNDPKASTTTVTYEKVDPNARGPFDPKPVEHEAQQAKPTESANDPVQSPPAPAENTPQNPGTQQGTPEPVEDQLLQQDLDRSYTPGVDGTAYTTQVNGLETGEPNVDFDNGVTVGGMSMGSVFEQSANPDPENVTMVNAKVDTAPEVDPALLAAQQQLPEMNTQTLGR